MEPSSHHENTTNATEPYAKICDWYPWSFLNACSLIPFLQIFSFVYEFQVQLNCILEYNGC